MAADDHRIALQRFLRLFHRGAKHIGMHQPDSRRSVAYPWPFTQMVNLHVVAHGLDIQQVGDLERHGFVGRASERELLRAGLFIWLLHFFRRCMLRLLHLLQFLIQQPCLFQFHCQILVSELESPIESDGEGEEGDDGQRLQIVAQREPIALHQTAHHKVAIQTDKQGYQRRVDELEAQIAVDDIADATFVGAGHADNISQNDLCDETTEQA